MRQVFFSSQFCFWEKWGEDREFCLWRINGLALEHGDFLKNHFWEPVFGLLDLGMPIKWGFLLPKKEMPILLFLGFTIFGEKEPVFGEQAVGFEKSPIKQTSLEKQMV